MPQIIAIRTWRSRGVIFSTWPCRIVTQLPKTEVGRIGARWYQPTMSEDSFATRIRSLRRRHELSQMALANVLEVTKTTVWKWERWGVMPRLSKVQALANIFGVTEAYLLTGRAAHEPTETDEANLNFTTPANLKDEIAECRERIANLLCTTPDKVEITVKL